MQGMMFGFGMREPSDGMGYLYLGKTSNPWRTDAARADD